MPEIQRRSDPRVRARLFSVEWLGMGITLGWPRDIRPA